MCSFNSATWGDNVETYARGDSYRGVGGLLFGHVGRPRGDDADPAWLADVRSASIRPRGATTWRHEPCTVALRRKLKLQFGHVGRPRGDLARADVRRRAARASIRPRGATT